MYDGFIIRGFENDANIYRNGLRSRCFRYETANLEQIEVLKGPAAVLYDRIEPGGLVNLVSKRPLEQPYYALEQQFGSYDLYRTVAEATGPITSDGSLLYRFDLAYQSNNSFLDFVDLERVFVSPSLTWRLSERTEINLNVEYQDDTMQDESGIPAIGRRPAPVPINRYFQDDVAVDETDRVLVELSWSHRFSEHWALRNRFQANLTDYNQTILTPAGFLDDRTLDRGLWDVGATRDYYATNLDLTGHVEAYGIAHDLLAGVDYWRYNEDFLGFCCNPPEAAVPPIDIFASSAEFVGTDLRRIYASDSLLGIKLRSIGPKFWVSKNLLGC
ncbi:MAG: TonB-dependent siderophore receptor, partial [Gammaproteobacteria bacterium]